MPRPLAGTQDVEGNRAPARNFPIHGRSAAYSREDHARRGRSRRHRDALRAVKRHMRTVRIRPVAGSRTGSCGSIHGSRRRAAECLRAERQPQCKRWLDGQPPRLFECSPFFLRKVRFFDHGPIAGKSFGLIPVLGGAPRAEQRPDELAHIALPKMATEAPPQCARRAYQPLRRAPASNLLDSRSDLHAAIRHSSSTRLAASGSAVRRSIHAH